MKSSIIMMNDVSGSEGGIKLNNNKTISSLTSIKMQALQPKSLLISLPSSSSSTSFEDNNKKATDNFNDKDKGNNNEIKEQIPNEDEDSSINVLHNNGSNSSLSLHYEYAGSNPIKDLFPEHSQKIDALEQRFTNSPLPPFGNSPLSANCNIPVTSTSNSPSTSTPTSTPSPTYASTSTPISTHSSTSTTNSSIINSNVIVNNSPIRKLQLSPFAASSIDVTIPTSSFSTIPSSSSTNSIVMIPARTHKTNDNNSSSNNKTIPSYVTPVVVHASPSKKRGRFTLEEDELVQRGVLKFGENWEKIRKWSKLERSSSQIRSRHRRVEELRKACDHLQTELNEVLNSSGKISSNNGSKKSIQNYLSKYPEPPLKQPKTTSNMSPSKADEYNELNLHVEEIDAKIENLASGLCLMKSSQETFLEEIKSKDLEIKSKDLALQDIKAKHVKDIKTLNDSIKDLLIKSQKIEKRMAREKLLNESIRLGQISFERRGTDFVEVYQEGRAFASIKQKLIDIDEERGVIESYRKQLKQQKKGKSDKDGSPKLNNNNINDSDNEYEEILRIKLISLKKMEIELADAKSTLIAEKHLHIRELKRVADEDMSRFNNFPTLMDRYLLLKLLGKGGFSEVFLGFDLIEHRYTACKIHSLNSNWNEGKKRNYTKHACREYNIHKQLDCPKVVKLYDVFEIDENSFCTVLAYCGGGDLDSHLKVNKTLSEREAKSIFYQILLGLKYLNHQKRPIIHYDLKPGNILFSSEGEVKITDFGLSKIMEEGTDVMELTSQGAGTYWYLPPECFEIGHIPPKISSKVDVWSAGVIFYQMLIGRKPFGNNLSQQKILQQNVILQANDVEFPQRPVVSREAKDIIRLCLTPIQADRPDAASLLSEHPYFKKKEITSKAMPPPRKHY